MKYFILGFVLVVLFALVTNSFAITCSEKNGLVIEDGKMIKCLTNNQKKQTIEEFNKMLIKSYIHNSSKSFNK